ncbi:hypothetical protein GCM10009076_01830 [Erythrobacter ramosus]
MEATSAYLDHSDTIIHPISPNRHFPSSLARARESSGARAGATKGERNGNYQHGRQTKEALALRAEARQLLKMVREGFDRERGASHACSSDAMSQTAVQLDRGSVADVV